MGTILFLLIGLVTIVGIVLINEGQRRIPVHHAKRVRAGRVYGGSTTHIPLKVNSAGMIPLIFAVSIMVFPGMIASFLQGSDREWVRNFAPELTRVFSPELDLPVQRDLLLHGGRLHLLLHDGRSSSSRRSPRTCSGRARSSPASGPGATPPST